MSYVNYYFQVDPETFEFGFSFEYHIDGYYDPETGEYFGDTNWTASYVNGRGQIVTIQGGTLPEGGYGAVWLGFDTTPGLQHSVLQFAASNPFTADGLSARWDVFSAAFETTSQRITGTATDDIIIGGSANDRLFGGDGYDRLFGGRGDDRLEGGAGNDELNGGLGADRLIGGLGEDTYWVDNAGDRVIEAANQGYDVVWSSVNFHMSANIEELNLVGTATSATGNAQNNVISGNALANTIRGADGNDRLYGNDGLDQLFGGAGDDFLDGGSGADALSGGAGNDNYWIDNAGDRVIEARNQGIDNIAILSSSTLTTYTLGANVENLSVAGLALHGIGNNLANAMLGGWYNDVLDGRAGDDAIDGFVGDDRLLGGRGNDVLTGGVGADTFVFNRGDGFDQIAEFTRFEHDVIELHLGARFDSYDEVMRAARSTGDHGQDTTFTFGSDVLVLHDVDRNTLIISDFLFV